MSLIAERLRQRWLAQGDQAQPGVSEEQLREFEARFGVCLPADMRDYFLHTDGRGAEWMFYDDLLNFSSLSQVFRLSDTYQMHGIADPSSYYVFADFALYLPGYAIHLSPESTDANPVIAYHCHDGRYVASIVALSFSDFAERYLDEQAMI
jgi:cell wall assembly regulator SMI1